MNGIVRRAILGKVPVYGICDRHHVPPHRAWYGVRHPCGQTHVLFFTDNTLIYFFLTFLLFTLMRVQRESERADAATVVA